MAQEDRPLQKLQLTKSRQMRICTSDCDQMGLQRLLIVSQVNRAVLSKLTI
jgi:hypothetical protein